MERATHTTLFPWPPFSSKSLPESMSKRNLFSDTCLASGRYPSIEVTPSIRYPPNLFICFQCYYPSTAMIRIVGGCSGFRYRKADSTSSTCQREIAIRPLDISVGSSFPVNATILMITIHGHLNGALVKRAKGIVSPEPTRAKHKRC